MMKRIVALAIVCCLLAAFVPVISVNAAQDKTESYTISLLSNVIPNTNITLYKNDGVDYISVDDLCQLARVTKVSQSGKLTLTQGMWSAVIDLTEGTFSDATQSASIKLLNQDGKTCVPALMILSYFKATAFIQDNCLYCVMPQQTVWEQLEVDVSNTLSNFAPGEDQPVRRMKFDIIMDMLGMDTENEYDYINDSIAMSLVINPFTAESVQQSVASQVETVENYLSTNAGKELTNALRKRFAIMPDVAGWYFDLYTGNKSLEFTSYAYGGTTATELFTFRNADSAMVKAFYAKNGTDSLSSVSTQLLVRAAARFANGYEDHFTSSQFVVSNVMGEDAVERLEIEGFAGTTWDYEPQVIKDGELLTEEGAIVNRFAAADNYNTLTAADLTTAAALEQAIALRSGLDLQAPANGVLNENPLAILYLSKLQNYEYEALLAAKQKLLEEPDNSTHYYTYLSAMNLYCRTSMALYGMVKDVDGELVHADYRDQLALQFYNTELLYSSDYMEYYPMQLESFQLGGVKDYNRYIAYYRDLMDDLYDNIRGGWVREENNSGLFYDYENVSLYNTGYAFINLDDDGIPELIVTEVDAGRGGEIYDLYTIYEGQIIHLLSASKRDRYHLTGFNSIINSGSSGAGYSVDIIYYVDKGQLKVHRALIFDYEANHDDPWFYCGKQTNNQDPDTFIEENRYNITEEKADAVIAELPASKWITTKRMSDYPRHP